MRQFADPTGTEWQVFEVRRSTDKEGAVTPGREGGWLAFASANERRRLAPIPSNWDSLADERLVDLCASADLVVQRHDEFIRERRRVPRLVRRPPADGTLGRRATDVTVAPTPAAAYSNDKPAVDVDGMVAQLANECRANGTTVIAGMVSLRRTLVGLGIDPNSDVSKRARRQFVTAFYFEK